MKDLTLFAAIHPLMHDLLPQMLATPHHEWYDMLKMVKAGQKAGLSSSLTAMQESWNKRLRRLLHTNF